MQPMDYKTPLVYTTKYCRQLPEGNQASISQTVRTNLGLVLGDSKNLRLVLKLGRVTRHNNPR